jgi:type IV secretory pathway TraG/TraD family ATPase VirD4
MSSRRYDDRNKPYLLLGVLGLTLAAWFFAMFKTYRIPHGHLWEGLYFAAISTPNNPQLWIPPLVALLWGMAVFIIIVAYTVTHFGVLEFVQFIRGTKITSAPMLRDLCKEMGKKQLRFLTIPVPLNKEHLHFEAVGSTGSGKSQAIEEYLESALERGDRVVCVDPNGTFMSKFFQEGDLILNPFDSRGQAWSIFNEIQTPYDVEQFAVSLIPKSPSTEHEQWNAMARTVVAETMLKLKKLGKDNNKQLIHWLTIATNDDLAKLLSDTPAVGMFHGSDETLGSVRTVLTRYVSVHKFLQEREKDEIPFSIRTWLEKGQGGMGGRGNLWITWREDMLEAVKPLISCQIDVICAASLSSEVENAIEMHLVIDELDSLDKLNYLVHTATKGRKHKMHIFAGFQSYAQLDKTNGKDDAMTLRNSLRNSASLGVADKDTYTAEQIKVAIGEHEVTRRKVTLSGGTAGGRGTTNVVNEREFLVLPSEVHSLPDLTGYVKLSGDLPVARVTMKYKKRPRVTDPLLLIDSKWTNLITSEKRPFLA